MAFTRVGKTYQLIVNNGKDLQHALNLDEALWAATSAPADAFNCDPALIQILDPNKTGQITAKALKEAISWLLDKITDHSLITAEPQESLPLSQLNPQTAQPLITSADYILKNVCAQESKSISLTQIRDFFTKVAKLPFNGDGVISLAGAAEISPEYKELITHVVAATGGAPDADGTVGATQKNILDFLTAVKDFLDWQRQGTIPAEQQATDIMPLGKETPACHTLFKQADPLVQQVFKLSKLMVFDQRIAGKTMGTEANLATFDPANQSQVDAFLKKLPLAKPSPSLTVPLDAQRVNPAYSNLWDKIRQQIIVPILGNDLTELTPAHWAQIKTAFAPYEAYLGTKKGASVEAIPAELLNRYLEQTESLTATTEEAIKRDKVVTDINTAAKEVEKLLLLKNHIIRLANNFISFPELYDPNTRALFEKGSLVIDGRWFNLAFKVANVPAHQALAKRSLLCILYVEVDPAPAPKYSVAVPVTYGSIGNLAVGKRGVFIDLQGHEHGAKVTHLITNPVCIREALLAPFVKMGKMVEGKIESWSNASEKTALTDFGKAVANPTATAAKVPTPPPKAPADKQGMFLGASVAIAALGSAFAFISNSLSAMSSMALCITVICALIALIAPLTIMAFIKLSKQDLSAMLEGCGWAINLRMRLTTRLRGQFTRFGNYPKDAKGTPKSRRLLIAMIIIILLLALSFGVKWIQKTISEQKKPVTAAQTVQPQPATAKPATAKPATAKPAVKK